MAQAQTEPKLLLPCLQPFYDAVVPLSWLVVRVAVGWNLLVHGWNKIMIGPTDAFLKGYSASRRRLCGSGPRPLSKRWPVSRSSLVCSPGSSPPLLPSSC